MFRTRREPPLAADALDDLIDKEKFAFVSRNLERCGYLKVIREDDATDGAVVLTVSFTLDGTRRWHSAEAVIDPRRAQAVDVANAFQRLEDGIGAARIARLFGPSRSAVASAGSDHQHGFP